MTEKKKIFNEESNSIIILCIIIIVLITVDKEKQMTKKIKEGFIQLIKSNYLQRFESGQRNEVTTSAELEIKNEES